MINPNFDLTDSTLGIFLQYLLVKKFSRSNVYRNNQNLQIYTDFQTADKREKKIVASNKITFRATQ